MDRNDVQTLAHNEAWYIHNEEPLPDEVRYLTSIEVPQ